MKFNNIIQEALYVLGYYLFRYKRHLKRYIPDEEWITRTSDAQRCTDNAFIPRTENAGKIEGNYQIMHNGIKIMLGSYYGFGTTYLMQENKGVHEPQEERVFQEVLKFMPEGATMIELGAFWAFYSVWFNKTVKNANSYMIEPEYLSLVKGKVNFKINHCKGEFLNAYAGQRSDFKGKETPTVSVDDFITLKQIRHVNILHSDIQGYEYEMLKGAINSIRKKIIDYVFISTHSNEIHDKCLALLVEHDYEIIASANLDESYSVDGLIVARLKTLSGLGKIELDLKKKGL